MQHKTASINRKTPNFLISQFVLCHLTDTLGTKNSPTGQITRKPPNLYELMPIGLSRSPEGTEAHYHGDALRKVFCRQ